MKIRIKFFLIALCAIGVLSLVGCKEEPPHFKTPPWLGGSSIEILKEEGNYTNFLRLMEIANYKEPISKQLFTLFVPDDDAFEAYFNKIGKNSIEEFTKEEAVQLFTLHVLRNPRSRFLLVYEYVYSEFQGPDHGHNGEYMSLFNRKQTPSVATPYTETVRYYEGDLKGKELLMTSGRKYVPLFTDEWFHDYGSLDAKGDYLFMYPESSWKEGYTADMPGTNWHGAMVLPHMNESEELELEVRSASGFIYYIDRVIEPIPSIDEYMEKNQDKYGTYYDILQRFATYESSGSNSDGKVLYKKSYDLVYNLADETAGSINIEDNKFPQNMWTAFLPTDDVLDEYLENTVLKNYLHIDSVPRVTLYYILQSQLSETLVLMSQMEKTYFNAFGDQMEKTRADLNQAGSFMASNGVIYESKKIIEPNVFSCVPGVLFFDKNYTTLLFVLSKAEALITAADPTKPVLLFASTNEQLEEYGVRYNAIDDIIEFRSPANGQWSEMTKDNLVSFAQNQIVFGTQSDFSGYGFMKTSSGTYINYSNNVVQASENQGSDTPANVISVEENERNGYVVKVDRPIQSRFTIGQYLASEEDVSIFHDLLDDLKYINKRGSDPITREKFEILKFYVEDKVWSALIPTNEAMLKAISEGVIPDVTVSNWDKTLTTEEINSMKDWVDYHFIKGDVIFDDGKLSGNFSTRFSYSSEDGKSTLYTQIKIINESNNLSILDATGQNVVVDHTKANILVKKGVVHKLDTVLKLKE